MVEPPIRQFFFLDRKAVGILEFPKGIKVQLSNERREFVMFEKCRYNFGFEHIRFLHNERFPILGPTGDGRITRIDHVKGFCNVENERKREREDEST
jgi:hypothetical protein